MRAGLVRRRDTAGLLGSLEAEVMSVLWEAGTPLSVRETADRLNIGRTAPLAYTTVMTMMNKMAMNLMHGGIAAGIRSAT